MGKVQSLGSRIKSVEMSQTKRQLKEVSEELFNQAKMNRNLTTLLGGLVKQQQMAIQQLTDESLTDFFRSTDAMSDNDYAPRIAALRDLLALFGISDKPQIEVAHEVLLGFEGYDVHLHVQPSEETKRQIITMSLMTAVKADTLRKLVTATPEEIAQIEQTASKLTQ